MIMNWKQFELHLQWHDWHYEYANSHQEYEHGVNSLRKLNERLQEALSEDFERAVTLWNKYAPKGFKKDIEFLKIGR